MSRETAIACCGNYTEHTQILRVLGGGRGMQSFSTLQQCLSILPLGLKWLKVAVVWHAAVCENHMKLQHFHPCTMQLYALHPDHVPREY